MAVALASSPGFAQTWVGGRLTPDLAEIVAIDATGEAGWLYGKEDLVGDGDAFKQQEQSIDIRTAYAATDATRFWARVYVSDPNAVGGNVTAYVFIDADENLTTGGSAAAPEINAKFAADPTPGGYDYAIELRGNGSVPFIWVWNQGQMQFVGAAPPGPGAEHRRGALQARRDPRRLRDHGGLGPPAHGRSLGSRAVPIQLSKARALSVREYLVKKGVKADRLSSDGYGPDKPLVKGTDPESRAKNRRVEFIME